MSILNVVVFASVGGGNFEALVEHAHEHAYRITKLIANKECGAIEKAQKHSVDYAVISLKGDELFREINKVIPANTDLIVLGGFMPIIPGWFCEQWYHKIINIHPSLLPKYGGKGMYGVKVQEAVMANHEVYGGCTVHYVEAGIDTGEIIEQWSLRVDYSLTPWEFGGEVFVRGAAMLPYVIDRLAKIDRPV